MKIGMEKTQPCIQWASEITAAWNRSIEGIVQTGQLLQSAKASLPHGEFLEMVRKELPFGEDTAQRLMRIADHERIRDPATWRHLPIFWRSLSELARLTSEQFDEWLQKEWIWPEMRYLDCLTAWKFLKEEEGDIKPSAAKRDRPALTELEKARNEYVGLVLQLSMKERGYEIARLLPLTVTPFPDRMDEHSERSKRRQRSQNNTASFALSVGARK